MKWRPIDEEFKTLTDAERAAWVRGTVRGLVLGLALGASLGWFAASVLTVGR